jgi:fructose/tagatose bisphosphate aldolase
LKSDENTERSIFIIIQYEIDTLIDGAVFAGSSITRKEYRQKIQQLALGSGIYPASIQGLYSAAGKGLYSNVTVPAINIRGITYHVARAIFKAAIKNKVGAFIFELARSEIDYTAQKPDEYTSCILAAALREGFKGPVFIQGDHFQINRKRYGSEADNELKDISNLVQEAVSAGFLNIDIDASTLVNLEKHSLEEQQEENCRITAVMTNLIRKIEPEGTTISIGGEIGEVGKSNSTVADLQAFMTGYLRRLDKDYAGISKISIQTGTTHGGVVLPNGSVASVKVDFKALEEISRAARVEYGLAGAVQHGASTLPDEAFDMFPKSGAIEVHLATGFQNLIYDSPYFPRELLDRIYKHLIEKYAGEKLPGDTRDQFLYKTRKRGFGEFKKEMWGIPEENMKELRTALEERFNLLFKKLGVVNTMELVNQYVGRSSTSQ